MLKLNKVATASQISEFHGVKFGQKRGKGKGYYIIS